MRRRIILLFLLCAAFAQSADEVSREVHLGLIHERLKHITPCPWTSDGTVAGWWNGEMRGVAIRSRANFRCYEYNPQLKMCMSSAEGGPVAQTFDTSWTGSHDPLADADFIAHACDDIEFLLKIAEGKK